LTFKKTLGKANFGRKIIEALTLQKLDYKFFNIGFKKSAA